MIPFCLFFSFIFLVALIFFGLFVEWRCRLYYHYDETQSNNTQYNTIQYNTIQYNTIQYNTIQYNTIQYNTE